MPGCFPIFCIRYIVLPENCVTTQTTFMHVLFISSSSCLLNFEDNLTLESNVIACSVAMFLDKLPDFRSGKNVLSWRKSFCSFRWILLYVTREDMILIKVKWSIAQCLRARSARTYIIYGSGIEWNSSIWTAIQNPYTATATPFVWFWTNLPKTLNSRKIW